MIAVGARPVFQAYEFCLFTVVARRGPIYLPSRVCKRRFVNRWILLHFHSHASCAPGAPMRLGRK